MAEAFLNIIGYGVCEAESAGLEAGILHPYVVEVMKELKIDISKTKLRTYLIFLSRANFIIT